VLIEPKTSYFANLCPSLVRHGKIRQEGRQEGSR
jgi:hypothetical protein